MNQALIEQRGAAVVVLARISGVVYTEAIVAGVPHALAQEMATDYWNNEVGRPSYASAEVDDE
ncbi:hypothetical protein [Streptomyces sp. NPDC048644]|uniref:hypothetical protein n=1 Tax=Streptomyces sp. NPDC048644 TaxID=3365582 RepID=UPI00371A5C18